MYIFLDGRVAAGPACTSSMTLVWGRYIDSMIFDKKNAEPQDGVAADEPDAKLSSQGRKVDMGRWALQ
jgi:hypothetical protein